MDDLKQLKILLYKLMTSKNLMSLKRKIIIEFLKMQLIDNKSNIDRRQFK